MKDQLLKDLIIKKLDPDYAPELSQLLQKENSSYSKYFIAFEFDFDTIQEKLSGLNADTFWGIFVADKLVGFYILRGFDEGYEIPAYGVWISKEYSNKGLSKLTLQHAISYCRINGIKRMMLKVHPDNVIAKKIYEDFGFKQTGIDPKNDNLIYHKDLF